MPNLFTKNKKASSGQALVEVMVAVSVLTVGFLGIVSLLSNALGLNRTIADNYTATYLAAEGIEVAKNILDANIVQKQGWSQGFADGDYELDYASKALVPFVPDNFLKLDPATGLYSYGGSVPTPFSRRVSIKLVSGNEIQVNSEVKWLGRGAANFSVNLEDHFFSWRQ